MLSQDRKTNRPLITALALEFISRQLRRVPASSAVLERSEYARRDRDIIWYLLRGSIWETWTRYVVFWLLRKHKLVTYDNACLDPSWMALRIEPRTRLSSAFSVPS